jgi:hypothetical protein
MEKVTLSSKGERIVHHFISMSKLASPIFVTNYSKKFRDSLAEKSIGSQMEKGQFGDIG